MRHHDMLAMPPMRGEGTIRLDRRNPLPGTANPSRPAIDTSRLWTLSGLALLAACGGGGGGGGGISAPGGGRLVVTAGGQNIPLLGSGVQEHNTNAVTAVPGGIAYGGTGRSIQGNAGTSVRNPVTGSDTANGGKGAAIAGTYGTVYLEAFSTLSGAGIVPDTSYAAFTYELNNNHARLDTLDAGQTITDTFTFSLNGGTHATRHVVTIGGINESSPTPESGIASADASDADPDAPTLRYRTDPATDGTLTIGEDSLEAVDAGVLVLGDPDTPAASLSIKAAVASGPEEPAAAGANALDYLPADGQVLGTYGVFIVGAPDPATGELRVTYTLDSAGAGHEAVQALDDGESLFEKLTLSVCDGAEQSQPVTLLVVIEGADEAPPGQAGDDGSPPLDIV